MNNRSPNDIQQDYDVVIAGAGPAGCTTARYLSTKFNTLLIDRAEFPRDKPCGGLLVKESQHFIKQLEPLDFIFSKPKKLNLRLLDWDNNVEVDVKREYVNILRNKFDYWLLQLVENGVNFSPKTELLDFYERKDGLNVVVGKDNKTKLIKAKYLVGADGAASLVRKRLSPNRMRAYVAIQESVKVEFNTHAYFIYDKAITDFYSWIIPKGDVVTVGSALPMANGNIRDRFEFLKKKIAKNLQLEGDYTDRESCLILRPESTRDINLGKNHVLLAGEAAGLISPSTGEGISFALRSGYLCARAINNLKDVHAEYEKSCGPLINEISNKLIKSDALSDIKTLKKVLEKWTTLSEPDGRGKALEIWAK